MSLDHTTDTAIGYDAICAFLYREARLLDDREGRVAARYVGALDGPSILSALVQTVLAEQ